MNYTAIFYAFIGLLLTVITGAILPYIKAKLGEVNFARVVKWVTAAVHAAEVLITESGAGERKKEAVLQDLAPILRKHNIEVTPEELNIVIEDAVKEMNKAAKLEDKE